MSTSDLSPNTSPTAAGAPAPLTAGRIGVSDVERIEEATRAFRALDYRYGGGACRDAVVGYLPWGLRMLGGDATALVANPPRDPHGAHPPRDRQAAQQPRAQRDHE